MLFKGEWEKLVEVTYITEEKMTEGYGQKTEYWDILFWGTMSHGSHERRGGTGKIRSAF